MKTKRILIRNGERVELSVRYIDPVKLDGSNVAGKLNLVLTGPAHLNLVSTKTALVPIWKAVRTRQRARRMWFRVQRWVAVLGGN